MSSADDPNQLPLGKLPYERPKRVEPPLSLEEQRTLAMDPVKWKPVSLGLALIFWGYFAVLTVVGLFTLLYLYNQIKVKIDVDDIREIGMGAGAICFVGILLVIAGECLCSAVPKVARGRILIILSVLAMITMMVSLGVFVVTWEAPPEPPPVPPPDAQAAAPAIQPAPEKAVADADPNKLPVVVIKKGPLWPGLTVPANIKFLILGAYLVSQFFFILFLKKVAIFFHNTFLADSMGGYLTLFIVHTLLVAFLPTAALIACFFWIVMLGLKFVLAIWLLKMMAATRRAIG
jgi:hypothetical protein